MADRKAGGMRCENSKVESNIYREREGMEKNAFSSSFYYFCGGREEGGRFRFACLNRGFSGFGEATRRSRKKSNIVFKINYLLIKNY